MQAMQGEMLRSNGEAYERWRELEERHEKALTSLQEQTAAIEKLSARNAELKEINSQLDFQWGEKYAALRDAKEKENVEERERRKREVEEAERAGRENIQRLKDEFRGDIGVLEQELRAKLAQERERCTALRDRYEKVAEKGREMKELLRLSLKSEEKKQAIAEELKAALARVQSQAATEKEAVERERREIETMKRALKEESLEAKKRLEELEYRFREGEGRKENLEKFLNSKKSENEALAKEVD